MEGWTQRKDAMVLALKMEVGVGGGWTKKYRQPLGARKGKAMTSSLEPPRGMQAY